MKTIKFDGFVAMEFFFQDKRASVNFWAAIRIV